MSTFELSPEEFAEMEQNDDVQLSCECIDHTHRRY